jgi:predicted  nucleic acid-binding Zn ribbon protein
VEGASADEPQTNEAGCLDVDEGRTCDQILSLGQAIDRGARDEVASCASSGMRGNRYLSARAFQPDAALLFYRTRYAVGAAGVVDDLFRRDNLCPGCSSRWL